MSSIRFKRNEITDVVQRPAWWRVRIDEIAAAVSDVQKGAVETIAHSAGGHPIHAISYGPPRPKPGTGTWAIASNSRDMSAYKTNEAGPQTVIVLAGVHGAEPEGVAGVMNLIQLLETGRDLRGEPNAALLELCARYRLVIVPCLNPDGRDVSPDHLRGASANDFRRISQGWWKDGTEVGYPACKQYSPLPLDRVGHPGGYPNADGYNIQHDAAPGDIRTAEARALLKLVADEQADLVLNLHSHSIAPRSLSPSVCEYPLHTTRILQYAQRFHDDLAAAGLRPEPPLPESNRMGYSLNNAASLASGALALTFEFPTVAEWTFEEMLQIFYVALGTCLRWGATERFAPRADLARGRTEASGA
jgi:predicted deacylase